MQKRKKTKEGGREILLKEDIFWTQIRLLFV
jgi:hypothetical protein